MFDVTLLILLGLAALGFISHNTTVAVSILVLIIVRVTPLKQKTEFSVSCHLIAMFHSARYPNRILRWHHPQSIFHRTGNCTM